jgi:hypothetical protein
MMITTSTTTHLTRAMALALLVVALLCGRLPSVTHGICRVEPAIVRIC